MDMVKLTRVLVIGDAGQHDTVVGALPRCDVRLAAHSLDGVWQGGKQQFDGAFVSLGSNSKPMRVINSLRRVSPKMRIVVGCAPSDEPIARRALTEGADDYVIEPAMPEDIQAAFGLRPPARRSAPRAAAADTPTSREIVSLGEVLRNLGDGELSAISRLAELVKEAFDASGVVLQVDNLERRAGDSDEIVLEATIMRQGSPVGRIALARRVHGAYAANTGLRLAHYARLIEAVVSQAAERSHWRELALTDELSKLHNRRYFETALAQLVDRAAAQHLQLTVLLFDIDDFKTYNDRFGHDNGDKLIQEIAELMRRCTREHDIVARFGGDEFSIVFWDSEKPRVPGSHHPREPIDLAERFCKAIADHDFKCLGVDAPGTVTISGGLACFPWNGATPEALIFAADQALLNAKRTGKNRLLLAGSTADADNPQ